MQFPEDVRYTAEHEWIRVEGDRAVVGITDFAQDSLGDVVFVELPEVGGEVAAAATCSEIESTKSVSEIYAPVSGTIVAVNEALVERPELVNEDPFGDGWIFAIAMTEPSQVDGLLDAAAYRAQVEGDA